MPNPVINRRLVSPRAVGAVIPTSNLQARWESDSLVLNDGDPVSLWLDQSPQGRNASQSTAANKPIFKTNIFGSMPALLFDGSNDTLGFAVNFDISGAFTVFAVVEPQTGTSAYNFALMSWGDDTGNTGNGFKLNADGSGTTSSYVPHLTVVSGGSETVNKKMGSSADSGSKYILTWTYNGTTATGRKNATSQTLTTSDGGYGGQHPGLIGFSFAFYKGYAAAFLVYSTVLSAGDITTVENYLNTKYTVY